jgi:hypothetical protein
VSAKLAEAALAVAAGTRTIRAPRETDAEAPAMSAERG